MEREWNRSGEIEHCEKIWNYRRPTHIQHTKEVWNERAHEWADELKSDTLHRANSDRRVEATVEYLRSKGLLGKTDEAIDIGCGPGRFVAQFARTARHVVGTDLSSQMLEYGAQYAGELGLKNTSYVECDFKQADIDALGWAGRFDLVFSSITPAISGLEGLEKILRMSRAWCFNSCFVHSEDELESKILKEVWNKSRSDGWDGHWHWFYALFNLLWLRGYYPETTYYKERWDEKYTADRDTAKDYADRIAKDFGWNREGLEEPIYRYLSEQADENGMVDRRSERTYGWILWDVRNKTDR